MNGALVGGALFAAFSGWMLRHALRNYRAALASESWPSVEGKLVELGLWGTRNIDGEMKPAEKLSAWYEFDVDGTHHVGTEVAFYTLVYPETTEFAAAHHEGGYVRVHYNPGNPSESVLIPGPRQGSKRYGELILGSFGLVASVVVAVAGALELVR